MWKFLRPDATKVWEDGTIREKFARYRSILDGELPARYLVAKKFEAPVVEGLDTSAAFGVHEEARGRFAVFLGDVDSGEVDLGALPDPVHSYLDLKVDLAGKLLESCGFCERSCGVDRTSGKIGVCGVGVDALVSSAFAHVGEESPLVPSGTIFFTGCTFKCVFCQNYDISQEWRGPSGRGSYSRVDAEGLAKLAISLVERGVRNINYVGGDPTSHAHAVLESLKFQHHNVTQLWNSNFYLSSRLMGLLGDAMDFWLPDFKYGNDDCARKYSKVDNYWAVVTRNHQWVHDEGSGEMIIRHLVMPNHVECCTKPILEWVAANLPKSVVNLMGQYRPEYRAADYPEISRRPSRGEMEEAKSYASDLGICWEPVS
ncbi:MAG: radical SAM protein [Promethearchaeota archaeon]